MAKILEAMIDRLVPKSVLARLGRYINRQEPEIQREALGRSGYVAVPQELLDNCKLFSNRYLMLSAMPIGGVVMELGVDEGSFSSAILERIRPRILHLVDPWDSSRYGDAKYNAVLKRFESEIEVGRVQIHRTDSFRGLESMEDHSLDCMYIDTTHDHETTTRELELGRRKVKVEGGMIAGHDYTQGNVFVGVAYGVVNPVNEFCKQNDWEFVYLTHEPSRHLSFAIRKR